MVPGRGARWFARGAVLAATVGAAALITQLVYAQSLAGQWTETTRSQDVAVRSWGANCPERPQPSSSRPNLPVEVGVDADQLVFPRGRRTDRCWSSNPALRRTRFSKQGNRYIVECRTPPDDSRQEHGTYVIAADRERITIELTSVYEWTLNEDHCDATIVERWVLTRTAPPEPQDAGAPAADDGVALDLRNPFADGGIGDGDVFVRVGPGARALPPPSEPRVCDRPGPPVRLRIRGPRVVRPGDAAALTARRVDAADCDLGEVAARFQVAGATPGGTVTPGGQFRACDSVALCDGERVRIEAAAEGLTGTTVVQISARIERGLGTVGALEPGATAPDEAGGPAGGAQVRTTLRAEGRAPGERGPQEREGAEATGEGREAGKATDASSQVLLWVIVVGGGLVILGVLLYLVLSVRRRRPADVVDDLAGFGMPAAAGAAQPESGAHPKHSVASAVMPVSAPIEGIPVMEPPREGAVPAKAAPEPVRHVWHCPACRKEYPAAGHCRADGLRTIQGTAPPPARGVEYVGCPRCGRGYSKEAKFCPADRELLLPYGMAAADYRARHRDEPAPRERVCPRCGLHLPGTALFCANDGEALRTLQ
ncbi:MAG: hypothetical protein QME96_13130 [Myxococcota bacterium]|nr:hypothetical protein [Myxococcota bacterium]